MCLRAATIRAIYRPASTSSQHRVLPYIAKQSQLRFTPSKQSFPAPRRLFHSNNYRAQQVYVKSGLSLTTVILVTGIVIGGALLFPLGKSTPNNHTKEEERSGLFSLEDITDSYLVMAPNMPPGRPGTLTPEQERKLRELWALTMKVFGVYEPLSSPLNGAATPLSPTSESTEASAKKEKKSRLRVFSRSKKDKQDSESTAASGATTPADISTLSIADEDDKHGLNKDFKAALQNSTPEELRRAFWSMVKHDHPDALLLRFLRARKWDVDKALVMMISTMHWRAEEMHVDDDVILKGEAALLEESKSSDTKLKKEGEDFLSQLRMGKSFLHGVDKEGRPMCIVRVRLHRQGEQSEQSLERFTVYLIETARMLLRPPVDTATIVFDMTNFSMANMDYTPVKFMIKCFEANYPESLGAVLVHKSPWIFQGIWSIIRGWLDPVVAGKVHFTKNAEELESFIPRSQIPTELGGDEKWEYSYVEPDPNENTLLSDTATRDSIQASRTELVSKYESTVLDWIHAGEAGKDEGEKGKSLEERRKERDTLAEELRANYWKLDPYVRARTLYDRTRIISTDGKLSFYPEKEKKENVPPATAAPAVETSPDDLD